MAKFKKGDRVRDTEAMRDGVIVEVDAEKPGYYAVKYDTRPQPQWNVPESYLTLANSAPIRSANSVVQNAINARTARNADGDGAAVKAIRDLQRRIAPLAREAEAMRGKFIANKWYGYDAALEFIAKRLKEAEAEGEW